MPVLRRIYDFQQQATILSKDQLEFADKVYT
jgi:hypothetical protein